MTPDNIIKRKFLDYTVSSENPGEIILNAEREGILKDIIPELSALSGIPQPPKYHPEVDTLVHVAMTMDKIAMLDGDLATRWAVLLHDLGKAVTPKDILPHHYGHEEAGVPIVEQVCRRFEIDEDIHQTALIICENHGRGHSVLEAKPKSILKLFNKIGVFKYEKDYADLMVERFSKACLADHLGRPVYEHLPYYPGQFFISVYQNVSPLIFEGRSAGKTLENQKFVQEISEKIKELKSFISSENMINMEL